MKKLFTILLLLFAVLQPVIGQQQIERSSEKIRKNGKVYYIHKVLNGQTVYSISKAYNVSIDELIQNNRFLGRGLKAGQRLTIPDMGDAPAVAKTSTTKPVQQHVDNRDKKKDNDVADKKVDKEEEPKSKPASTSKSQPQAQSQPRLTEKVSVNYKKHKVKKKDTLYSIATKYGCTPEDIIKMNPHLAGYQLEKGEYIKIPLNPSSQTVGVSYHTVRQGETLSQIASMFNTTERELTENNKDAFDSRGALLPGTLLRVYGKTKPAEVRDTTPIIADTILKPYLAKSDCHSYTYYGQSLSVALLLPMNVYKLNTLPRVSKKDYDFIEFYEGFLFALDSLKHNGISVNLSVFDVYDERTLAQAMSSDGFEKAELIIGPVSAKLMKTVAEYGKEHRTPVVSPLDSKTESLAKGNKYFFQLTTPSFYQNQKLIGNICASNGNIVIVYNGDSDTAAVREQKQILTNCYKTAKTYQYLVNNRSNELAELLEPGMRNYIIVPSTDEVFVSDLLSKLNAIKLSKKMEIIVFGQPRWKTSMKNLNFEYLCNLKVVLAQSFYANKNRSEVKDFIKKYRFYYKGDPSQFSYLGFDIGVYFISELAKYGSVLAPCVETDLPKTLLQSRFKFKQISDEDGFTNSETFLLHHTPEMDVNVE